MNGKNSLFTKFVVYESMGRSILQAVSLLLIFLASIAMVGCAGPRVYIHPSPGLDRIKKIVVMPFKNLTKDDKASEKVRNNFVIELLRTGSFNVMYTGEVDRILQVEGLSYTLGQNMPPAIPGTPGTEEKPAASVPLSNKIGSALNAEAILVGSVDAYSTTKSADQTIPDVSISVMLIDAETGTIIWASTHTRRGSAGIPVIGWGRVTSLSVLSQKVIGDMVNSLAEYIR